MQSIEPLAKLDFDPKPWKETLEKATALFRTDPKIESLTAICPVSRRESIFRQHRRHCHAARLHSLFADADGSTQAATECGWIARPISPPRSSKELPTPREFQADAAKMMETLKALREAPDGGRRLSRPGSFLAGCGDRHFRRHGRRQCAGNPAEARRHPRAPRAIMRRITRAASCRFLVRDDDPTLKTFGGKTLIGSYDMDDEGVRAAKVPVIQNGEL